MRSAKNWLRILVPRILRNLLRSPGRTAADLYDQLSYILGVRPTVAIRDDWGVRCHPAARRVVEASFVTDPDQRIELSRFVETCTPGMVLFDLGAHYGIVSLAALHYGGTNAHAIAVEPSPDACSMIRVLARLNHAGSRLEVVQAAATETSGRHRMVSTGPKAHHYYVSVEDDRPDGDYSEVAAVSIDDLTRRFRPPTHVKIDVEGLEGPVLQGAAETLRTHRPIVFLELHPAAIAALGRSIEEPLRLLSQGGYAIFDNQHRAVDPHQLTSIRGVTRVVAQPLADG